MTKKQLIISIGTGRSGSVSLANFLSRQDACIMLHEGRIEDKGIRQLIHWKNDESELWKWLDYMSNWSGSNKYYGDTGMYYLPYVEEIIKRFPNTKFIGLIRNKKAVVQSYLKKTDGRNHWYLHNGKNWKLDPKWDPCYPKYEEADKEKALGLYWEEYKTSTEELMAKYPKQVKMWTIETFNTDEGRNDILDFIGYTLERKIKEDIKLNEIKAKKSIIDKIKEWF